MKIVRRAWEFIRKRGTVPTLFISSYAPLFALFAIRFESYYLQGGCFAVAVISALCLYGILRSGRQLNGNTQSFVEVEDAGPEASAYLSGYLLPFLTASEPTLRDGLMFLGFLIIAYSIHSKSSLMQVNPTLYLRGWRVLKVTDNFGNKRYLITKKAVSSRESVKCSRLSNDVYLDIR